MTNPARRVMEVVEPAEVACARHHLQLGGRHRGHDASADVLPWDEPTRWAESRPLPVDLALTRPAPTDPDVAALVDRGAQVLLEECRAIAQRLEDEGRLAPPWSVDTATDLMWNFMFPDGLQRFTVERHWSTEQYRELLTVLLHRPMVSD